ncbi:glycosyltransferase family 2 protein [Corynebacterium yudongzhengii]|uniref:glycosyltransferase family 2 protein n=1 Tax=Corynebacterium yudongzhengii TaxID=2080740 RepID=UPI001304F715|nr:glycosyltransferase family 2 protein [Corynebacterium yudongzhengii]
MSHPALSVVIPCYNDATLLERALESLAPQLSGDDEIIVVDNNSTDGSASIAEGFSGVRVVEEKRQGITWAAACGYNEARGEVIVRTDADIRAGRDFLDKHRALWAQHRNTELVAITGNGHFELPAPWNVIASVIYLRAYLWTTGSALGHPPLWGTNYSMLTSWWHGVREHVDPRDTAVHDDLHLSFAVRPAEKVLFARDIVVEMDPRPLRQGGRQGLRFRRGMHTMLKNFRFSPPYRRLPERWARLRT